MSKILSVHTLAVAFGNLETCAKTGDEGCTYQHASSTKRSCLSRVLQPVVDRRDQYWGYGGADSKKIIRRDC